MKKKNKNRNYKCYRGILHTFGENGSLTYHKRIYYRYVINKEGNEVAKEILTGKEFPTAIGVMLGQYTNVDNFVSSIIEVYDYEIDNYLRNILSDKRILNKEIGEILLSNNIEMTDTNKKRIKK